MHTAIYLYDEKNRPFYAVLFLAPNKRLKLRIVLASKCETVAGPAPVQSVCTMHKEDDGRKPLYKVVQTRWFVKTHRHAQQAAYRLWTRYELTRGSAIHAPIPPRKDCS
eukprot:6203739-Pleurochrysis_carterae.AAC.1